MSEQIKICPKHGPYKLETCEIFSRVIELKCPQCEAEETEREQQEMAETERRRIREDLQERGIEPEYYGKTLDDYQAENTSENEALEAAKQLQDGRLGKLLLTGSNGCGKTLIASAIAQKLNGCVTTMFKLSADIRKGYGENRSEIETLDNLLRYPFIAIDEVGQTKGSDAERNWLSYLIDKAHTRGIRIMLISNKHIARSLPQDRKAEAIEYYFENSVISRLRQNSKIVEVTGRDRRAAPGRTGTTMAAV